MELYGITWIFHLMVQSKQVISWVINFKNPLNKWIKDTYIYKKLSYSVEKKVLSDFKAKGDI